MDAASLDFHANIVPRHSGLGFLVNIWHLELSWVVNVWDSEIAKICAFPKFLFLWFCIIVNQFMLLSIPSAITKIQSSQKCNFLINDYNFFMMAPQKRNKYEIRMPQDLDIGIHFLQIIFNKLWIIIQGYLRLHVQNNINLNPLHCNIFKDIIQPTVSIRQLRRSFQLEIWCHHPVSDVHVLFCLKDFLLDSSEVLFAVDVVICMTVLLYRGKAFISVEVFVWAFLVWLF